jgi:hypothetical protein
MADARSLPLATLLSQALVAFTIEVDNASEQGPSSREEKGWRARFGARAAEALRAPLERLQPRLFEGLQPPASGWRARLKPPDILPHHPMVLHRGGYPDGA